MDEELITPEEELITEEDGSVIVQLPEEEVEEDYTSEFGDNLALRITPADRLQIAGDLIELVEHDKKARERRQEQYEEGIRRTGLGDDAPGGAQFKGASRVVHPMLAEACVDFEARAIKELMPSGGPVKTQITSSAIAEKLEIAQIKRDILNRQLTKQIPEFRDELESLLSQLPMGGSQYSKMWWDGKRKRFEFIPIDHIFLPFNSTNAYSTPRLTHQQLITRNEYEARVKSELYLSTSSSSDPIAASNNRSIVDVANDKIEGQEDPGPYNEDGFREVYEIYLDEDYTEYDPLNTEGTQAYIAHIDVHNSELLGLYRNWDPETGEKLHWIVDWGFVPWRGAYKLGLPHLIGGLSAAATGSLRALLDSAHAANAPTLLKLKQGRLVGQTTDVAVTQVQEIEGPTGIDDIRKLVTPIPFAGPSPILFQLLGFLVDAGKGVVATAEEKISDVSDRMPVGTALAMIEQGSKVYSAIHMRLHQSMERVLDILCRLNAKYPEDWSEVVGKPVPPELFEDSSDICPVTDPNIFSEAQRYAQNQAVLQLASDPTIPYNRVEVHRRMLLLLNVPDIDGILPEVPHPKKLDAVQENMAAVLGTGLKTYPDQDHMAHIEVHLRFILSPVFGANPLIGGDKLMPILNHCTEHLVMLYPQLIARGQVLAMGSGKLLPDSSTDRQLAVGSALADQESKLLAPILQMMGMAQKLVQSKLPPPPMDPQVQATLEVAKLEDARVKEKNQSELKLKENELNGKAMREAAEFEASQRDTQHTQEMDKLRLETEEKLKLLSEQMALMRNESDNKQHQITELLKNRDDNQTQVIIAQIRDQLKAQPEAQPKQDDSMLKEMQRLLGELKEAKTNQALETVVAGLQTVISGQQQHQERMMQAASQLLQGSE